MTRFSPVLALAFLALPTTALAQPEHAPDPNVPVHRVDVLVPLAGIGGFFAPAADYDRLIVTLGVEVRYAHRSGHGVLGRATWGTNVWGEGWGGEIDYLYRVPLAGDRQTSLGLDLMAGVTLAGLRHNEQTLPTGFHPGANVGVSLDFRSHSFVVSLGGRYRVLVPVEAALDGTGAGPAHVVTGTLGAGFTFY